MIEEWKDVIGYEELYHVSNMGRVKSLRRTVNNNGGTRVIDESIRKLQIDIYGYVCVGLHKDGNCRMHKVHSLVLSSFIGERPNRFDGSHLNGISNDNSLSNLCWESKVNNNRRKKIHGTTPIGEKSSRSKLKDHCVIDIKNMLISGFTHSSIAKKFGVCRKTIGNIHTGRNWSHI